MAKISRVNEKEIWPEGSVPMSPKLFAVLKLWRANVGVEVEGGEIAVATRSEPVTKKVVFSTVAVVCIVVLAGETGNGIP